MNQYIITEEQLLVMTSWATNKGVCLYEKRLSIATDVRSHPYNPQAEREKVLEQLNDFRRYANGEYKEADLSDNEHDLRIHLEYENRIWGIMKDLRQQGKQEEQG